MYKLKEKEKMKWEHRELKRAGKCAGVLSKTAYGYER